MAPVERAWREERRGRSVLRGPAILAVAMSLASWEVIPAATMTLGVAHWSVDYDRSGFHGVVGLGGSASGVCGLVDGSGSGVQSLLSSGSGWNFVGGGNGLTVPTEAGDCPQLLYALVDYP